MLETPNRRWFDVLQPRTLNREPFYFLNLEPGTDQFTFNLLLGHDTACIPQNLNIYAPKAHLLS